jgi:hypothetical protein
MSPNFLNFTINTTLILAFSVVLHLMLLLLIYPQLYIPTTRQIVFTVPPPSLPRLCYLKLWFTYLAESAACLPQSATELYPQPAAQLASFTSDRRLARTGAPPVGGGSILPHCAISHLRRSLRDNPPINLSPVFRRSASLRYVHLMLKLSYELL